MTSDEIVDRVRSLCVSEPFGFFEVEKWDSFNEVPTTAIDGAFRIPPPSSQSVVGGFNFVADKTDSMQIWVARKHQGDYPAVRRALLRDIHSLTAAIVRDAAEDSGEYHIPDGGWGHVITPDSKGLEYVTLRLTLPINYEVQL